jgi:hypothetical protein
MGIHSSAVDPRYQFDQIVLPARSGERINQAAEKENICEYRRTVSSMKSHSACVAFPCTKGAEYRAQTPQPGSRLLQRLLRGWLHDILLPKNCQPEGFYVRATTPAPNAPVYRAIWGLSLLSVRQ